MMNKEQKLKASPRLDSAPTSQNTAQPPVAQVNVPDISEAVAKAKAAKKKTSEKAASAAAWLDSLLAYTQTTRRQLPLNMKGPGMSVERYELYDKKATVFIVRDVDGTELARREVNDDVQYHSAQSLRERIRDERLQASRNEQTTKRRGSKICYCGERGCIIGPFVYREG